MRDYRKLKVWQRAHRLALSVYAATRRFPKEELQGLGSDLRRSCVAIAANIAAGCGKTGDEEFVRSLQLAAASASELEYQLLLAQDLGLLDHAVHHPLATELDEIQQQLAVLIQKYRPDRPATRSYFPF